MTSDVTVILRGGEYALEDQLNFVCYRFWPRWLQSGLQELSLASGPSFTTESVITGWQLDSGNVYRAPVGWTFHTLYENGVHAVKARHPNSFPSNPYIYNRTTARIEGVDTTRFGFAANDIPWVANPASLEVVLWPGAPTVRGIGHAKTSAWRPWTTTTRL
jgi:hypothetical protein